MHDKRLVDAYGGEARTGAMLRRDKQVLIVAWHGAGRRFRHDKQVLIVAWHGAGRRFRHDKQVLIRGRAGAESQLSVMGPKR